MGGCPGAGKALILNRISSILPGHQEAAESEGDSPKPQVLSRI